jgi:hypothetical protein
MGTRCRGLGEICARLTGPVQGQITTRVQITERKSIIPQIVNRCRRLPPSAYVDGVIRGTLMV